MKQDHYIAKQEDHFSSFHALFTHLNRLQRLQQENILAGIRRRQERRFKPVRAGALSKPPTLRDWVDFSTDFSQRSILFWDTLRQRGDDTLAHQREGFPILLKFDYEGKDEEVIGKPDRLLIGPPSVLSEHNPDRVFPEL